MAEAKEGTDPAAATAKTASNVTHAASLAQRVPSTPFERILQEKKRVISQEQLKQRQLTQVASLLEKPGPSHVIFDIYQSVLDEVLLELAFDLHKQVKLGLDVFNCEETRHEAINKRYKIDEKPSDLRVPCHVCHQPVAATRFAPHLEKCLGLGRSRAATRRRVVNYNESQRRGAGSASQGAGLFSSSSASAPDDEADEDYDDSKRSRKKTTGTSSALTQPSPKRQRKVTPSPNQSGTDGEGIFTTTELSELLHTVCGAVSSAKLKLCSHTQRCPQHTDAQRQEARRQLTAPGSTVTVAKGTLKVSSWRPSPAPGPGGVSGSVSVS